MSEESLPRKVARAERSAWIRPGTLLTLYAGRLRRQWLQELLAAAGIATGVMLVFGVLAANTSIKTSAREIVKGIAGRAELQLRAIGGSGFDARLTDTVRAAPGVQVASAVLQTHATLRYGHRRVGVDLVGVDDAYARLGGVAARPALFRVFDLPGIYPTARAGEALGIGAGSAPSRPVTVDVRGRAQQIPVIGLLSRSEIGAPADTLTASASLHRAQRLSGLPGRATRILVVARPGGEDTARRSLERIARSTGLQAGRVDDELRALAIATAPNDQSTTLFAAIAAIVGLLLTAMAMLLTVPERRRELARMRVVGGFTSKQAAQVLLSQAFILGVAASAVGVLAGDLMAHTAAQAPPGYLAFAFPIGSEIDIEAWMIVTAVVGGTLCTCLAAATPLTDLRPGRAIHAIYGTAGQPGQSISSAVRSRLALASVALIAIASVVVALAPALTSLSPHPYRVAAITTNLGWGPGAIAMNADDYRRDWASATPTALEVDVKAGGSPAHVRDEIRAALGPATGLQVKTTPQAVADAHRIVRDGLARLGQISTLLLIAAAIAVAMAMSATIRERRPQLAAYAIEGWSRAALWRALMLETALILLAGCLAGAAAGTYGHYLLGRWLEQVTSFPSPWSWSPGAALPVCALLAGVALLVTALPGYLAAQPAGRLAVERR